MIPSTIGAHVKSVHRGNELIGYQAFAGVFRGIDRVHQITDNVVHPDIISAWKAANALRNHMLTLASKEKKVCEALEMAINDLES